MLNLTRPAEAYRRVELDARIAGADGRELVLLCFERFEQALGTALAAFDIAARSAALTRALAAVTALELGLDSTQPLAAPLRQLYSGARKAILNGAVRFDRPVLTQVLNDFAEVRAALRAA